MEPGAAVVKKCKVRTASMVWHNTTMSRQYTAIFESASKALLLLLAHLFSLGLHPSPQPTDPAHRGPSPA